MGNATSEDVDDFTKKRAKQYLLFMVQRWETNNEPLKRVVARYAVGD